MEPNQTDLDLAGANALLMSGGVRAEKYDHPGAVVLGTILSAKEDFEYEMEMQNGKWTRTGEIRKWKSGEVKKQIVVTVQTELREDETDDGRRLMFFDSYRLPALRDAIQKAGAKSLAIGAQVAKRWDSGSGTPGDPKVYTVAYVAPALDSGSLFANGNGNGHTAPAAAPVAAAPPVAAPTASPTLGSMLAGNSTTPAADAVPPGVDPQVWEGLPPAQKQAIRAAMSNPAATAPPF